MAVRSAGTRPAGAGRGLLRPAHRPCKVRTRYSALTPATRQPASRTGVTATQHKPDHCLSKLHVTKPGSKRRRSAEPPPHASAPRRRGRGACWEVWSMPCVCGQPRTMPPVRQRARGGAGAGGRPLRSGPTGAGVARW